MEKRDKIRRRENDCCKMRKSEKNGGVCFLSKQFLVLIEFILIIFLFISLTSAYTKSAVQYTQYIGPGTGFLSGEYKPNMEECKAGQDFVIQIAPFGCEPAVVRTDLLEEQNVPVFCQLVATKLNPMIKVEAIDSISFQGKYPEEIQGVGFHPAQGALGIKEKLNSPILENIGYAVIVLKKQPDTRKISDYVQGTMTAKIKYDIKNAFGIGKTTFYLPIIEDNDWEDRKTQYSFWDGKGYLRAEDINDDNAKISVYEGSRKITSVSLKKGEKSEDIFLPGMSDCLATMDLRLEGLEYPGTRAKLNINGEVVEVSDEERFLDNECRVTNIDKKGLVKEVSISCDVDDIETGKTKTDKFTLKANPKIRFKDDENNYQIGDKLPIEKESKVFYLGFIGTKKNSEEETDLYALVVEMPSNKVFDGKIISSVVSYDKRCITVDKNQVISKSDKTGCKDDDWAVKDIIHGKDITLVKYNEVVSINSGGVLLQGFSEPLNKKLEGDTEKNYKLAMSDFETVTNNYPSEKDPTDETSILGEEAYLEAIYLSFATEQKLKTKELCEEFNEKYPDVYEEWGLDRQFCDDVKLSDTETPSHDVAINGKTRAISLEEIIEPDEDEYSASIFISGPSIAESYDFGKLETKSLASIGGSENSLVQLINLKDDSAEINVVTKTTQKIEEFTLNKASNTRTIDKYTLTLIIEGNALKIKVKRDSREEEYIIKKEKTITLDGVGGLSNEKVEIVEIDNIKNTANIKITYNKESTSDSKKLTLKKDVIESFGDYTFTLTKINLKKMAKVSVIPNIKNAETEANFTFKIAIEQRAIKLSPEQTKEKIKILEENIKEWESKTEKLGNVVQGMKGACLATSTILIAKNFLANTGGKGIARQDVMEKWSKKCQGLVGEGKEYEDNEQCYTDTANAEQIEKDIEEYLKIMENSDKKFNVFQEGCTKESPLPLFGETIVDDKCVNDKSFDVDSKQLKEKSKLDASIGKCFSGGIEVKKGETQEIGKITKLITKDNSQVTSVRDLEVLAEICNNDNLKTLFSEELKTKLTDVWVNDEQDAVISSTQEELKNAGFTTQISSYGPKDSTEGVYHEGQISREQISIDNIASLNLEDKKYPYEIINYANSFYFLILDGSGSTYNIKEDGIYKYENTQNNQVIISEATEDEKSEIKRYFKSFKKYDSSSYQNQFKSVAGESGVVIKLYDTEPYKGYPALVPFDQKNGWYAAMRQTLPVLGNIKSYESSGRIYSFYLCNVGSDGVADFFSGINEDKCQMINPGIKINTFSGLNQDKTDELAGCAINAIEQVSRVSVKGSKTGDFITINTGSKCGGSWKLKIGAPAVEVPEMQCQNFMSVEDCQILYNVCDPVICPSSRCDLGGAYPVTNVIQQGIIGGVALCLPNFNPDPMKGVVVPLCLSGIHAGLEGWVSILKNHRDCLQESLDTGKMIGVCDEISSIYKCEFFWRQGLPLAKIAIPKLLERLYGQATRGGGEYLGIQSAWDNAGKSADYFTQYYGANSFEAFKSRTVEEVGEEACRLSVSASYPDGGNLLDSLTEPDSPPQFHGRFDETPFSDVTIPPISHYKVFYHIYAGENSRAYYQVYLKGSPDSTYYQDTKQKLIVASGYIQTGGYASETKDFTATSGYKDMCIVVNGQEMCGFKEVSTSFAINYVKDKYMEEQASQTNIKTETECIAGSRSAYALINPSIQGAAEELASPSLYNRGITRICATDNPGKGTDANANANNSRWVNVGYCENEKMRCWLDTDSVSDVIKNLDIEAETLEKMNKQNLDVLEQSGKYLSDDAINQEIKEIESLQRGGKYQDVITKATEILEKTLWNNQKAKLYLERGIAYGRLAKQEFDTMKKETPETKVFVPEKTGEVVDCGIINNIDSCNSKENCYWFDRYPFVSSLPILDLGGCKECPLTISSVLKDEKECTDLCLECSSLNCEWNGINCDLKTEIKQAQRTNAQMIKLMNYAYQNSFVNRKCLCGELDCSSYAKLINEASIKNSIPDSLLLLSLMMQESECVNNRHSDSSYGLMQINSWEICKNELGLTSKADVLGEKNIKNNIYCGAIILKQYYNTYGERGIKFDGCTNRNIEYFLWEAALRAYNGNGCGTDTKTGEQLVAQDNFVEEIMERYKLLSDYLEKNP